MPICKLCQTEQKLIKAHVIPNWAYVPLKASHIVALTSDAKSRKIQSGFWDSNILCAKCDNEILGRLDNYGKQFLTQQFQIKNLKDPQGSREHQYIHIADFDCTALKLFFVSILWRASISTIKSFSIDLGKYEEVVRNMILANCVDDCSFPIVLFMADTSLRGDKFENVILAPIKRRFGQAICYSITLANFEAIVKVSDVRSEIHIEGLQVVTGDCPIIITEFETTAAGKYLEHIRKALRAKPKDSAPVSLPALPSRALK